MNPIVVSIVFTNEHESLETYKRIDYTRKNGPHRWGRKRKDINFLGKEYIIFYSKKNSERKSSRIFKVHRNYELFIFLRIQNNSRMRERMRKWFVTISDIIFRDFTTWKLEKLLIRNKYIYIYSSPYLQACTWRFIRSWVLLKPGLSRFRCFI